MLDLTLIPEQAVEANGNGPEIDLGDAAGKKFLLTLRITRILEQESLDVSVFGSEDKATWTPKSLVAFPQKFYAGETQILLDLTGHPGIKHLRGEWKLGRWGRGRPAARFTFSLQIRELAAELAA
jgi:hypothetical protein